MAAVNKQRRVMLSLILLYKKRRNNWLNRRKRILATLSLILERRRREVLSILTAITTQIGQITTFRIHNNRFRSCRRRLRNTGWWDVVWNSYEDERFKQTFRLSKATFNYVLSFIRDRITKDVNVEVPICPEMRLGICLYRLRGDYMYTIGEMAGIAESTVCQIVIEVSEAIVETLWKDGVDKYFPQTEKDFKTGLLDMDEEWQFPFAFCGIDGSHLPIKCPNGGSESMKQYYNFKNFYSVILLALVDAKYRII